MTFLKPGSSTNNTYGHFSSVFSETTWFRIMKSLTILSFLWKCYNLWWLRPGVCELCSLLAIFNWQQWETHRRFSKVPTRQEWVDMKCLWWPGAPNVLEVFVISIYCNYCHRYILNFTEWLLLIPEMMFRDNSPQCWSYKIGVDSGLSLFSQVYIVLRVFVAKAIVGSWDDL